MRIIAVIFSISIFLFFSQCRSGRLITNAIAAKDTAKVVVINTSVDSLILVNSAREIIQKSKIDFKTFSAKIKLDIEDSKGKKPD
ncbi:MAG: hypothetical protein ACKVOM_05145, partial [Ferruginibacter sp.]